METEQLVSTIVIIATIAVATTFVTAFFICLIKEEIRERKKQKALKR